MNKPLHAWLQLASVAEQEKLAKLANTTRATLHQLAGGHHIASAAKAAALEHASARMPEHLPRLRRTDMCPACRVCEYAKRCGG